MIGSKGWLVLLVFVSVSSIFSRSLASDGSPISGEEQIFLMPLEKILNLSVALTGTHIKRDDFQGPSSLRVISREDLDATGANSLIGALKKIPLFGNGTFSSQNNTSDTTANGSASVSLRGLGADSTLILVNGRRVTVSPFAYDIDTAFVDLNNIPLSNVERVEILKDGASAIYGSDAIAGVVNIILRRDAEGVELSGRTGYTADGGGKEQNLSLTWGSQNDLGSHIVMLDLFDREAIFRGDRDYSASADQRSRGGFDRRSSMGFPGSFSLDSAAYIEEFGQAAFDALPDDAKLSYADIYGNDTCADESITSGSLGTRCRYDFNPSSSLLPESHRVGLTYLGEHRFSNILSGRAELSYMHRRTTVFGAPTPANNNAFIAGDNPNHPLAALPAHPLHDLPLKIRRRLVEAGDRQKEMESDHYRMVLGLEGRKNNWDWQVAYTRSQTTSIEKGVGGFVNANRLQAAIDDGSFNVFEPSLNSGDAIRFIQTNTTRDGKSKSSSFNGELSKDVFTLREDADIVMALGLERRKDFIEDNPDSQYLRGEINGTEFTQGRSSRRSTAVFLELAIPATDELDIQLASRHESYSDFGNTSNPKVAFRWSPVESLAIRSSWGTAFRAPSLIQLGLGATNESPSLIDTHRCLATGDPLDCEPREYEAIVQGNPELSPEKSTNYNFGIVWNIANDVAIGIDYWNFNVEDLISRNAQFIVDTYGLDSSFVERGVSVTPGVPGEIDIVYDTYANIGGLRTDGLDLYLNYTLASVLGEFSFTPYFTYVLGLKESRPSGQTTNDGVAVFESVDLNGEYNNPKLRAEFPVSWRKDHWLSSVRFNYIGRYRENVARGAMERKIDDWLSTDVRVTYSGLKNITLSAGASNITNTKPPLAQTETVGFDNRVHSVQGRFLYGEAKYAF